MIDKAKAMEIEEQNHESARKLDERKALREQEKYEKEKRDREDAVLFSAFRKAKREREYEKPENNMDVFVQVIANSKSDVRVNVKKKRIFDNDKLMILLSVFAIACVIADIIVNVSNMI